MKRMLLLLSLAAMLVLPLTVFSQQPADVAAKFNRAVELQRQGALKEAAAEYGAILAEHPNYAEAHANLAAVLARTGRYREAVASYETALRLDKTLIEILLNLGIAHYRAGQFDKSEETLKRFLTANPVSLQARQLLGLTLVELGRDAEAIAQLEPLAIPASADPTMLYSLGLAYLRSRRSEFRKIAERLALTPEGAAAARLLIGQSRMAEGDYKGAVEELAAAARSNPNLPRLNYSLGLSYLTLGQHTEAIAFFENEIRRIPRDFWTLFYLAYLYDMAKNTEVARERLNVALQLAPQSPEANALHGKMLIARSEFAEALVPLEVAVKGDPRDAESRYLLARVYQRLGRRQDAAREFAEAQRLKSQRLESERTRMIK